MQPIRLVSVVACGLLLWSETNAEDWPQWQGLRRDAVWREKGIVRKLPVGGPPVSWQANIAGGYAGPAVAGGRVFVPDYLTDGDQSNNPEQRNELKGTERVLCFAEKDGELLWKHEYPCAYNISYPAGPRATPTVDGDRVYVLGAEGNLTCLNVHNGEVIWSRALKEDYAVKPPMWGYAGHPLVHGDKLFCLVGGEGSAAVALDKMTGQEIWRALSTPDIGYSPPTLIQAGGAHQLLIWHAKSLNSLDPDSGRLYWSESLDPDYGMSIIPPRQAGEFLFVGAIKTKSLLLRLNPQKPTAEVVWTGKLRRGIAPSHSPPFVDPEAPDYMYGVDRGGELRCVRLATGQHLWSTYDLMASKRRTDPGTAFLVKNGELFFIFTETAELLIAKLSPEGFQEISRSQPLLETTQDAFGRQVVWSHPAFANGAMFARNDKELIRVSLSAD